MKNTIIIAALAAASASIVSARTKRAQAWFSDTHSAVFETALEILKKDGKAKAYEFFSQHSKHIGYGAVVPDFKGDRNKGSGTHYYSSLDKNGKRLQKTPEGYYANRLFKYAKSARTMLEENLTMSKIQLANGMTDAAMDSLGRCLHFISDVGCSVHTTNLTALPIRNNPHHRYESYALANMDRFHADSCGEELYNKYLNNDIGEMINGLSEKSSEFYDDVKSGIEDSLEHVLSEMLPETERHAAAFLNSYYENMSKAKADFLKAGGVYRIKSAADGRYLTHIDSGRIVLDRLGRGAGQEFSLDFNKDGSFRFNAGKYSMVCEGVFGFKLDCCLRNSGYMLTSVGGAYRISTEYSRYEKVFENAGRKSRMSLFQKSFDPAKKGQLWEFESVKEI